MAWLSPRGRSSGRYPAPVQEPEPLRLALPGPDVRLRVMPPNAAPPGASRVSELDAAWSLGAAGPRHRAIRAAAERVRDRFAAGPRAVSVRSKARV